MLTLAELLRVENPHVDELKQVHRRLIGHVQASRTTSADHGEMTNEILELLVDISTRQIGVVHAEARSQMLDASSSWRKANDVRQVAEQALESSRRMSWSSVATADKVRAM